MKTLLPPDTTTPAPDVQAHDDSEPLDTHGRIYRAGRERGQADAQAQIDAAYKRGVEDGLKRAKP